MGFHFRLSTGVACLSCLINKMGWCVPPSGHCENCETWGVMGLSMESAPEEANAGGHWSQVGVTQGTRPAL